MESKYAKNSGVIQKKKAYNLNFNRLHLSKSDSASKSARVILGINEPNKIMFKVR